MFRFLPGRMSRNAMRRQMGMHGDSFGVRRPRRRRRGGLALLILSCIGGYFLYQEQKQRMFPLPQTPLVGRVEYVTDGDTFHLRGYPIRVWGIDAPERGTPYADEATRTLQNIVARREISCSATGRSHERLVAACTVDGSDLSRMMVRLGYARELPRITGGMFSNDEKLARAEKRGMWK